MREQKAVIIHRRTREENTLIGEQEAATIEESKRTCYFLRSFTLFYNSPLCEARKCRSAYKSLYIRSRQLSIGLNSSPVNRYRQVL